jgi:hypothetical protein
MGDGWGYLGFFVGRGRDAYLNYELRMGGALHSSSAAICTGNEVSNCG